MTEALNRPAPRSGRWLAAGAAIALPLALCGEALAEWPEKDVTLIVHSGAGSSTDIMARALATAAEEVTGHSFVVANRERSSEAMAALQRAQPDGYTIGTQTRSMLAPIATGRMPYDLEDFTLIARLVAEPYALAVQTDSGYATLDDLLAAAEAEPGAVTMSTYSTGTTHQVAALLFEKAAGVDFNLIPYDSGSDIVIAMLGGNVEVANTNPGIISQHVEAGDARVLAVSGDDRVEAFPDAPTYQEAGYDLTQYHWRGLVGPAGIPDEVLEEMDQVFSEAAEHQAFRDYVATAGLELRYQGSQEFQASVEGELTDVEVIVSELGLAGQ